MHFALLALLPVLVALMPTLADSAAKPGALAGRAGLGHRGFNNHSGPRRKIKRGACKAKTSGTAASSATSLSASAAASSAIGENAQATGNVSLAAAASSAVTAAVSSVEMSPSSAMVSSSASAAAASASAGSSSNGTASGDKAALTPNGIKAGMTLCTGIDEFSGKLGWCYDWTPTPSPPSGMVGVSMLWGDGGLASDQDDASRVAAFKELTTSPAYIIGFEEPDCSTTGSASMTVEAAATAWNSLIAPHGAEGSLLISPSMCKQADETFLTPFKALVTTEWDITNLHINKNSMDGVKKDLDHYWDTYGKPMWVTEFACVEDQSWTPCTDQTEINQFISDIVKLLEEDSRVYAYAYSNGVGLGDVWPAISNGQLTASGQAYLSANGRRSLDDLPAAADVSVKLPDYAKTLVKLSRHKSYHDDHVVQEEHEPRV